jgi:hypothetical protein
MTSDELRELSKSYGDAMARVVFASAADEIDRLTKRVSELEEDSMSRTAIRHVLRAFRCAAVNANDGEFSEHAVNCTKAIAWRLGIDMEASCK